MPGPGQNITAIQAAWTTAKAQLATVQTDANTLVTDLAALEATCDVLYSYGAGDVVDWLRRNAIQARLGFQPRISACGNTAQQLLSIWAPDLTKPRDTSSVDSRPISTTSTGQLAGLS
jgi:hypothetical protein